MQAEKPVSDNKKTPATLLDEHRQAFDPQAQPRDAGHDPSPGVESLAEVPDGKTTAHVFSLLASLLNPA